MTLFSKTQPKPGSGIPDYTPGPMNQAAEQEYFERGSKAVIEKNRWFIVAILLAISLATSVTTTAMLLPLKSVETVIVREADTGRLAADKATTGSWDPDQIAVSYFLNDWLGELYSINVSTIRKTMARAGEMVTGLAVVQLADLYKKENPLLALSQNPLIFREREFVSINFINTDTALIRYKLITRLDATHPATTVNYAMTINFTKIKPTTQAEAMKNPGGIFITSFSNSEESVKQ